MRLNTSASAEVALKREETLPTVLFPTNLPRGNQSWIWPWISPELDIDLFVIQSHQFGLSEVRTRWYCSLSGYFQAPIRHSKVTFHQEIIWWYLSWNEEEMFSYPQNLCLLIWLYQPWIRKARQPQLSNVLCSVTICI